VLCGVMVELCVYDLQLWYCDVGVFCVSCSIFRMCFVMCSGGMMWYVCVVVSILLVIVWFIWVCNGLWF
jgi:hypothetical protein